MRYKFMEPVIVYKLNGEVLTKEELNYLHKENEKLSFHTIAYLFDVKPVELYLYAVTFGISHRAEDHGFYEEADKLEKIDKEKREKYWNQKNKEETNEKNKVLLEKAEIIYGKERPEPIIHKISGNGKGYIDNDLVKYHDKKVMEIFNDLKRKPIVYYAKRDFTNKERMIPYRIRRKVLKRDNKQCKKCAIKTNLHYHHIKYFSQGGRHEVSNLVLLCISCHAEEHKGERVYSMLRSQADKILGVTA